MPRPGETAASQRSIQVRLATPTQARPRVRRVAIVSSQREAGTAADESRHPRSVDRFPNISFFSPELHICTTGAARVRKLGSAVAQVDGGGLRASFARGCSSLWPVLMSCHQVVQRSPRAGRLPSDRRLGVEPLDLVYR